VDVVGLWTTVRAWRTRRLWAVTWLVLARRQGRLRCRRSWARLDRTGFDQCRVGRVTGLRRRRSGVSAGQVVRQASVAAGVGGAGWLRAGRQSSSPRSELPHHGPDSPPSRSPKRSRKARPSRASTSSRRTRLCSRSGLTSRASTLPSGYGSRRSNTSR
jgi:hypothetical protein